MNKLVKPIVCVAILGIVVGLSVGCISYESIKATGGGWFEDIESGSICEFGFNVNLKDNPGAVANEKIFTGQFQFNDTSPGGVEFHLHDVVMLGNATEYCSYIMPEGATLEDSARFVGQDKKTENIRGIIVCDFGEHANDYIAISHIEEEEIEWHGFIQGGNIKVH